MIPAAPANAPSRSRPLTTEYELAEYELWVEPFAGHRRLCITTDFALPFESESLLQVAFIERRLFVYCRTSESGLWLAEPPGSAALAVISEVSARRTPVLLCEGVDSAGTFRQWLATWTHEGVSFQYTLAPECDA